jgi:hypothetical protein
MALWMLWEVDGIASAGEDVGDTTGAAEALDRSIARIRERAALSGIEDAVLLSNATEARELMLAEGHATVKGGLPWSVVVGRVRITLRPKDERV